MYYILFSKPIYLPRVHVDLSFSATIRKNNSERYCACDICDRNLSANGEYCNIIAVLTELDHEFCCT